MKICAYCFKNNLIDNAQFIKRSKAHNFKDICTDCFPLALAKLNQLIAFQKTNKDSIIKQVTVTIRNGQTNNN